MSPVFLTIVSSNYLAYARTLFDSIAAYYPGSRRVLCIVDTPDIALAEMRDLCTVLTLDELGLPHKDHFLYRYGVMELNTAVKPFALSWIARNMPESSAGIMYVDPDIQFFRPLTEVETLLSTGALLILTPHLTAPLYDDKMPSELSIMKAGVYNCGFLAIGAHEQREEFLSWWCRRLEFGAFVDFGAGLFTDQKWIDLAPGLFPDVHVLRHPGYNVAYWNLAHRPLGVDENGKYTAAGRELAFFHFSGIDPHDPKLLSKHQTRFDESDLGVFRPVYRRYFETLLANGYDRYSRIPYAYGRTKSGAPIVPEMRQVFRHRYDVNGPEPATDPFDLGPEAFDKPTDQLPKAAPRVSLLLYEAWKRRDLLRESFDLHSTQGREGLLAWSTSVGERVLGVGEAFLEGPKRELEQFKTSRQPRVIDALEGSHFPFLESARRTMSAIGLRAFDSIRKSPRLRRLYYQIPTRFRASTHRTLFRTIGKLSLWSAPAFDTTSKGSEPATDGLNLIGYFRGEFSIGECARAFAEAALKNGPPVSLLNFEGGPADRRGDRSFDKFLSSRAAHTVNLCFVNADQTPVLFDTLGSTLRNRYNVGFWFWELEKFPAAWLRSIALVDEVWVASSFVQRAVSEAAGGKPVRLLPYPIRISLEHPFNRREFGLAEQPFTFLFNFDYFSFIQRKNPAALIRAFKVAFPKDREVSLVMKSTGAKVAPQAADELRRLADADPRIVFLDANLNRTSMYGLLSVADAYVSLHRSEGLGLGLAESMYLGKPAIGTGYSGNLEFMNRENSCLVDFRLVDVPADAYPHTTGQKWADPDIDDAARWMRRIREDSSFREALAKRGQEHIRRHMSEQSASEALAFELDRIMLHLRSRAA